LKSPPEGAKWPGRAVSALAGEHVVVFLAEGVELALWIDHELLDLAVGLLEEPSDRPRLAAAGVRLQEHAAGDQALDVEADSLAGGVGSEGDHRGVSFMR